MKLNVGSSIQKSIYKRNEWICLDLSSQGRPNVVADAFQMPFKDNTFEEVHSIHVLEHLPRDKWPLMLNEIFRVLKVNGKAIIEVPDFEAQCRQFIKAVEEQNTVKIHVIRTGIWGKSDILGMGHQYGFDKLHLKKALYKIGFEEITLLDSKEDMISTHYRQGPVITVRGIKKHSDCKRDIKSMSFDELREFIIK